jgi:adenine deaminase
MNQNSFSIKGNIVDIVHKNIFSGEIHVVNGKIQSITPLPNLQTTHYILPGFIDSHVHIESSMLIPSEFAKLAVVHGTVATISDPHEIANVCGIKGVEFMIENGKTVNFKFNFGAPSCVPATSFETAGATINSNDVKKLLEKEEIIYLSEMMNFPGVLFKDEEVMKKLKAAVEMGKPIDGHAPGLKGEKAKQYIEAFGKDGEVIISTDHECFTKEEALDKLKYGMKIIIREGSAAKNFEALIDLLHDYEDHIMFCSDDKHPDSLAIGHINQLCQRAVAKGIDIFKVLKAACLNPVIHYKMKVGLLQPGNDADFIVTEDLVNFNILKTFINGKLVAENGKSYIKSVNVEPINQFNCNEINTNQLQIKVGDYPTRNNHIFVIEALEGQLITNKLLLQGKQQNNYWVSNVDNDILKMVVVNRYNNAPVAKCFIKNFGLKQGALASSVAHDSHNIVAVGCNDESLAKAINLVIKAKGGVSAVSNTNEKVVELPVAGLMSDKDGYAVAEAYTEIDRMTKNELGSTLAAPFMTLSFMALLVIPYLKLSDKGLFDGEKFEFVV